MLQEAEQPINFSYFSNTAMASVLSLMTDGKSVEVGLVGTTELSASRPKTGCPAPERSARRVRRWSGWASLQVNMAIMCADDSRIPVSYSQDYPQNYCSLQGNTPWPQPKIPNHLLIATREEEHSANRAFFSSLLTQISLVDRRDNTGHEKIEELIRIRVQTDLCIRRTIPRHGVSDFINPQSHGFGRAQFWI